MTESLEMAQMLGDADTDYDLMPDLEKLQRAIDEFLKPLDPSWISQREGAGGARLDYIETPKVMDLLDLHAPGWEWHITRVDLTSYIKQKDNRETTVTGVLVTGSLFCFGRRRDGLAFEELDWRGPEMVAKAAASDALKRAAVLFGVARELYRKEKDTGGSRQGNGGGGGQQPQRGFDASKMTGAATEAQLNFIRAAGPLGQEVGKSMFPGLSLKQIDKGQASQLIAEIGKRQKR